MEIHLQKTMTFFLSFDEWPLFHFFWCVAVFHLLLKNKQKTNYTVMLMRNPIGEFLF